MSTCEAMDEDLLSVVQGVPGQGQDLMPVLSPVASRDRKALQEGIRQGDAPTPLRRALEAAHLQADVGIPPQTCLPL